MRTVTYKSVLDRVAGYMGEVDGLTVEEAGLANVKANLFGRLGWESFWFPEWTLIERRTLRPDYASATAYTATTEVRDPATEACYQALRSTTGNPPTIGGLENSAYWALCQPQYSGSDWVTATAYTVGVIVRNPADGFFYQCHTAHTSGGSLDATKFGLLTNFIRSVDYAQAGQTVIGTLRAIWRVDPQTRVVTRPCDQLQTRLRADFIQVFGSETVFWVEFRERAPVWSGATRTDAATYAAGVTVYDATLGDYYLSLASISAGQSPTNTPAKWALVPVPYLLGEFLAQSIYAALTNKEQEVPENFGVQQAAGWPLLSAEIWRIEGQQGQAGQLRVVGR